MPVWYKYWICVVSICVLTTSLMAQSNRTAPFPKLQPAHVQDFSTLTSYPSACIKDGFWDDEGRFWLSTCTTGSIVNALYLFQFDGYTFRLVTEGLEKAPVVSVFKDLYQAQKLVGIGSSPKVEDNGLLFYDVRERKLEVYPFPGLLDIQVTADGALHIVTGIDGVLHFYEWVNNEASLIGRVQTSLKQPLNAFSDLVILHHDDQECWFITDDSRGIIRIDKTSFSLKTFDMSSFKGVTIETLSDKNTLWYTDASIIKAEQFYLAVPNNPTASLFRLNQVTDRFEVVEDMFNDWAALGLFKDDVGNLLFVFKKNNEYRAILEDPMGKRFDYSSFFSTLHDQRIHNVSGQNFKQKGIIYADRSVLFQTVQATESIKHYLPKTSIRAMISIGQDQYLVSTQSKKGAFIIDQRAGTVDPFLDQNGQRFELTFNRLLEDKQGLIWFAHHHRLYHYDPVHRVVTQHKKFARPIHLFNFIGDQEVAIVDNQRRLSIYNIATKTSTPFMVGDEPLVFGGFVHEMVFADGDILWVATNAGLWKINLALGRVEVLGTEPPFQNNRFLSMAQDKQGRLWLGTTTQGLHIYDPDQQTLKVVNTEDNLANNTVVSILTDDDGIRWVGTYNGISLLTADGDLLTNIFPDDGLVNAENNRYAAYNDGNGYLLIGTVSGLNIIDFASVKKHVLQNTKPLIYINDIAYQKNDTLSHDIPKGQESITLAAGAHHLKIDVALSSYIRPEKNSYAYTLQGIDKKWHFLGQQNTLHLNSLPAGKYDLLIRGFNANGQSTANTIVLPIHAYSFFYQQWWFYALCAIPFIGIGIFWIRRLRLEQARLAAAVEKATHQIREDKNLIEEQSVQLRALDKAKSKFFTNISHEFRTPLTVIGGMVDKIIEQPETWLKKGSAMIKRNNDNLLNLVNQILELRKLEVGAMDLNLVHGDIVRFIKYIGESFHSLGEDRHLTLHIHSEENAIFMDYDAEKILRIVSNLMSNAIKFTPERGEVFLFIKRIMPANQLCLSIQDTGIGIPSDKLTGIFDRFTQVNDSNTRKWEGTGIGLALTQELVKLLEGTISVDSEEGKGSTFTIHLPIHKQPGIEREELKKSIFIPAEPKVSVEALLFDDGGGDIIDENKPSLLLIEDNADVMEYLIACTQDHYSVIVAQDGQKGIDQAVEQVPDLIISDVMMPKKDGFEVCETLKQDRRTSHIPIILLTAKSDDESRIMGLRRGADAYLSKPFNQEELLVRLDNLLELRRALQERYTQNIPSVASDHKNLKQEDQFILRIREIVTVHMEDEQFGIAELCKAIAMGRTQVHNKIKSLTGRSTSLYVRLIRLQRAKELLKDVSKNISEIAYDTGFIHPNYFSRMFKEEFGQTPSQYREQVMTNT